MKRVHTSCLAALIAVGFLMVCAVSLNRTRAFVQSPSLNSGGMNTAKSKNTATSALTVRQSDFQGGAGDQSGADLYIAAASAGLHPAWVAGTDGASGLLVGYELTTFLSSFYTTLSPNASFSGLTQSGSTVYPVGGALPPTCGASDGVGDTEGKSMLARYTTGGVAIGCQSTNFFPYRGGEGNSHAIAVTESGTPYIYVTSSAENCGFGNTVFVLSKYDTSGGMINKVTEPGVSFGGFNCIGGSNAFGIAALNGNYYVAGQSNLTGAGETGGFRPVLMKYDSGLNRIWKQRPADVTGMFRAVAAFGGALYAAGNTSGNDYLIEKYDEAGNRAWSKTSGGAGDDVLTGVAGVGSHLFAVGYTNSAGAGGFDAVILEIDPATGDTLMTTPFGGAQDDLANGAASDGTYLYVVGESRSFASGAGNVVGQNDAMLLQFCLDNCLVVTNTNDSGAGSLRQAMTDAAASSGPNHVIFNIPTTDPGFVGGVFTIKPSSSELPVVRNNTTIDGNTQTIFTGDTNANGPEVVLNGSMLASGGCFFISGDNNTISGLVVNGFNGGAIGISYPVDSTPSNNQILNNYVGTDAAGTAAVPNGSGIDVHGFGSPSVQASNNVIQNNLISGNTGSAIGLCDAAQTNISNNLIGTDRTGTANLGNGSHGIIFVCAGAPNNLIDSNTIAFNGADGIHIEPDYRFLLTGMTGNKITQNSIHSNGGLGINLLPPPFGTVDGVTPNDPCDADSGGNLLQNFPVLTSASSDVASVNIIGSLNSTASTMFVIEFFSNPACDASGNGEGQVYLGSANVTTDGSCNATINATLPVAVAAGQFITATATDAANNTSEFSACVAIPLPCSTITLLPAVLANAKQGTAYGQTITAAGGVAPHTFAVTAGALPAGLTLATSGALSGTPAAFGTFTFTVTATDAIGCTGSRGYTLNVAPALTSINVTPADPMIEAGQTQQFTATGTFSDSSTRALTAAEGTFNATGAMSTGRVHHTATLLPNGKVLIAGGQPSVCLSCARGSLETAELYDPATNTFTPTGSMSIGRSFHTATLLNNGKVLITGGSPPGDVQFNLASAELYDPAAGTFALTGSMSMGRGAHTSTLLQNGKVLIAGGTNSYTCIGCGFCDGGDCFLNTAEIYDPAAGTFSTTAGPMVKKRDFHAATLLNDGKVLITGGRSLPFGSNCYAVLADAELYDPTTGTFTATGDMTATRVLHTATLLANGKVLVAGGAAAFCYFGTPGSGATLSSAEVYDPATGVFTATGNMSASRAFHTATRLYSGQVVVTGGAPCLSPCGAAVTTESYDAATGRFTPVNDLTVPRAIHTATLDATGRLLIAGGASTNICLGCNSGPGQASAELLTLWSSSNSTVAPINQLGRATGASSGTSTITATSGGISGNTTLTVKTLSSISVTPANSCVGAGNTQQMTATGTFSDSSTRTLAGNSWQSLAGMPMPRRLLAVAEVNGQIYTIGGCSSTCYQPGFNEDTTQATANQVYDPSTNTWATRASSPTILTQSTAASVNGKIYTFGGFYSNSVVQEYDPVADIWTIKSPMPTGRYALAAVALNGKIYVVGGQNGSTATNVVEEYDPATDTWATKAPMPTARHSLAVAAVNGKIYALGGAPDCCGNSQVNVVEEYNPTDNTWATKAPLPQTLQGLAATGINGKVYSFGGFVVCCVTVNPVYEYDPASNAWTTKTPMPTPRWETEAVVAGGKVYMIGGAHPGANANGANEAYTPPEVLWSSSNTAAASINEEGLASGLARGDTTITATSATNSSISGSTSLHVAAVGNANDSGPGSLRQAILDANANSGTDTIDFCIPGAAPYTIDLLSPLPTITDPVIIDGTTQLGFAGTPIIELNGTGAGAGASGLTISAGNSNVKGLVINRFSAQGIQLETNGGNIIQGNYLGTDVPGAVDLGNSAAGVAVFSSSGNTIGGSVASARNVISGNNVSGVNISAGSTGNFVRGNYIGTKANGAEALGNSLYGVLISSASNTVGGVTAADRNVISGNTYGIYLVGGNATGNMVRGNYIGADVSGTGGVGNAFSGVQIVSALNNTIGGNVAGAGNLISGNSNSGIRLINSAANNLVQGNFIGTDASGANPLPNFYGIHIDSSAANNTIGGAGAGNTVAFNSREGLNVFTAGAGNAIRANSILSNGTLGIDLGGNGVTLNDAGDADTGDNNLQNFPVILSANSNGSNTAIQASLNSTPNTVFTVDFYHSTAADPTGFGEGETYLGSRTVITDDGANTSFTATFAPAVAIGRVITATATDPAGNTSEFSGALVVSNASACATLEILPTSASFNNSGGTGSVGVIKAAGCSWTAVSNDTWITITGGSSGTGNGTVFYSVDSNPGGTARTGTVAIGGRTLTVFQSSGPTAIEMPVVSATAYDNGVFIEWQTGFEVNNLGFNLYREMDGKRALITPEMVAGTALMIGANTPLKSGHSYAWWDSGNADCGSGVGDCKNAQYWLEDVDTSGVRALYGPFKPAIVGGKPREKSQAALLSRAGRSDVQTTQLALPQAVSRRPEHLLVQADIASGLAVKMSISEEGWYRVTKEEISAAGLDPKADPRFLQLFLSGIEQAILVTKAGDGGFGSSYAIEFYATGQDTPYTNARTYWLVAGKQPGRRINVVKSEGIPGGARSFLYTAEVKERSIYFSALRNGEAENFFGRVIASQSVTQTMKLQHVDNAPPSEAEIVLALQGITDLPGSPGHRVRVTLNGAEVGLLLFDGQSHHVETLRVPHSLLKEGENAFTLTAENGDADVSLIDYIRLSYWHTYSAEQDALRMAAGIEGQSVSQTIEGFTNPLIRLMDVTNPAEPQELLGAIEEGKGDSSISVALTGARVLLAFTADRIKRPQMMPNEPSALRQQAGAQLLIITSEALAASFKPLQDLRRAQGLSVMTVGVEDIYDEFSFGEKSPYALRDFLLYAKSNWKTTPRYVLLAGDASFDPKNYLGFGNNDLAPTKLVDTDFMETASDDWLADFNGDGVADLAVGRLPARTPEEASLLVAKIIAYESASPAQEILLVSDANDGFDFEAANNQLVPSVPSTVKVTQIQRGRVGDETAKKNLLDGIQRGQKLVTYSGHGSVANWRANLLDEAAARALFNNRLPVFVMMTCLNGYFQNAASDSLAEALMKAERGGAAAVWASSGLTLPDKQAAMNQQLFSILFDAKIVKGQSITLGEATLKAKTAIGDSDIRRTWILFGDPAMRLK